MKLQCALVVVAGLGLAGCGGGGGGGSSDSDRGGEFSTGVTAADLVGTWTQEAEVYLESPTPDEWTWFRTDRQTIIVEQTEAGLRFTDCVSGGSLTGTLSGKVITFPLQPGIEAERTLDVEDASTLFTTVLNESFDILTDLSLSKVSSDTTISQASVNLSVKLEGYPTITPTSWSQLCVSTRVQQGNNYAEVKGQTVVAGYAATVGIRFASVPYFSVGNYTYPAANASLPVTGSFDLAVASVSGELSDPVSGSVAVQEDSANVRFRPSTLVMQSDLGLDVTLNGTVSIDKSWLALPAGE